MSREGQRESGISVAGEGFLLRGACEEELCIRFLLPLGFVVVVG